MPPTTLAMRRPRQCRTRSMASCATCCASSRVGHRISAPGVAALKLRGLVGSLRLALLGQRLRRVRRLRRTGARIRRVRLRFGFGLLLQQRVQHGQQEGGGLAAAGLAGDHQVDEARRRRLRRCRHGQRNGLVLHGGRLGEAQVVDGGDQFGRQAQLDEAVGRRSTASAAVGSASTASTAHRSASEVSRSSANRSRIAQARSRPALQKRRSCEFLIRERCREAALPSNG